MSDPRGVILWQGRSLLTDDPIVVVATGLRRGEPSENTATGRMIQVWIIRADKDPLSARREGADNAICGDCPYRHGLCYVNLYASGPTSVYDGLQRGIYPRYRPALHDRLFVDRAMRLGAYGDPTAAPLEAYRHVLPLVDGHTGYTHQWLTCDQRWRFFLMASVDSIAERHVAKSMGWRTFRVRDTGSDPLPTEIECPKSDRAGGRLTCEQCLACSGIRDSEQARDVSIEPHGGAAVMHSFRRRHALTLA